MARLLQSVCMPFAVAPSSESVLHGQPICTQASPFWLTNVAPVRRQSFYDFAPQSPDVQSNHKTLLIMLWRVFCNIRLSKQHCCCSPQHVHEAQALDRLSIRPSTSINGVQCTCIAGSPLSVSDQAIAGLGAGTTGALIACPTELIKCRLQAQTASKALPTRPSTGVLPIGLASLSQSGSGLASLTQARVHALGFSTIPLATAGTTPGALHMGHFTVSPPVTWLSV